jgi:hypothetical protein
VANALRHSTALHCRTGFLAAVQARNLLLQTGLAQQTLATVWNLADIDKVRVQIIIGFLGTGDRCSKHIISFQADS